MMQTHLYLKVFAAAVFFFCRDDLFSAICDNAYRSELSEVIYQVNLDAPLRRCCVATYNKLYPCDGFEICKDTFKSKATWMQERQYRITGLFS